MPRFHNIAGRNGDTQARPRVGLASIFIVRMRPARLPLSALEPVFPRLLLERVGTLLVGRGPSLAWQLQVV